MSDSADGYLAAALAVMEQHAMHRDRIDWQALRLASARRAAGASGPAHTYDAIRWALTQLEDQHSFFVPPRRTEDAGDGRDIAQEVMLPGGYLRVDRIAYLNVPGFEGSPRHATRYADALQSKIAELDATDPIGWMIDLTQDWGGDMWPMLAGLGPLLGEGPLGSFRFPHDPPAIWSYQAGQSCLDDVVRASTGTAGYRVRANAPPVALLMSETTASSGEAVLIAFVGRHNTRRFGTMTKGLTTANDSFPLPDGAALMITVGTFADRLGQIYGKALTPDLDVAGDCEQIERHAAAWIHTCHGSGRTNVTNAS